MPTWPATIPQKPRVSDYQEKRSGNVVRSNPAAGPIRTRRRYTARAPVFQASYELEGPDEYNALRAFWDDELADGSLQFELPSPNPYDTGTITVIATDDLMIRPLGGLMWQATLKLQEVPQ